MTNRGRSRTAFHPGCCKGSHQSRASASRSALALTGMGISEEEGAPSKAENFIFETQFARFGAYLLATFH